MTRTRKKANTLDKNELMEVVKPGISSERYVVSLSIPITMIDDPEAGVVYSSTYINDPVLKDISDFCTGILVTRVNKQSLSVEIDIAAPYLGSVYELVRKLPDEIELR